MSDATLVAGAGFALVAAAVYLMVGVRFRKPHAQGYARLASQAFRVWWMALALVTALGGVRTVLYLSGVTDLPLFLVLQELNLIGLCVALWGLLYYLVYLFGGRGRAWIFLAVFYLTYYVTIAWFTKNLEPIGLDVDAWSVSLETVGNAQEHPLFQALLGLLILPVVAGAVAYFTLYFRLEDRTSRFRVAVVSVSIIVWFLTGYLASLSRLNENVWWQVASQSLGLAAALAIYGAYNPPRWLRRRGIRDMEAEASSPASVRSGPD